MNQPSSINHRSNVQTFQELHLTFNLSELVFHVSSSDAVLLSLLLGSLGSASGRPVEEEPVSPEPRRTTLDLVAAGVSLRLLHASAKRQVGKGMGFDRV